MHAGNGFFSTNGGFEFPAVLGAGAVALALTGPGTLSLDHVLGHRLNRNWMRTLALATVVPAAFTVIARRHRALASMPAAAPPPAQAATGTGGSPAA